MRNDGEGVLSGSPWTAMPRMGVLSVAHAKHRAQAHRGETSRKPQNNKEENGRSSTSSELQG